MKTNWDFNSFNTHLYITKLKKNQPGSQHSLLAETGNFVPVSKESNRGFILDLGLHISSSFKEIGICKEFVSACIQ